MRIAVCLAAAGCFHSPTEPSTPADPLAHAATPAPGDDICAAITAVVPHARARFELLIASVDNDYAQTARANDSSFVTGGRSTGPTRGATTTPELDHVAGPRTPPFSHASAPPDPRVPASAPACPPLAD